MLLLANPCCRRLNAFNCAGVWRRRLSTVDNTKINHEDCDIVIVGGGPAGLALAAALGEIEYLYGT
jgi:ubiquinone biosynthesis monooxygenase Coq6